MLVTKLSKWGNSVGMIIPKNILAVLDLKMDDDVCFTVEGKKLIIRKVNPNEGLQKMPKVKEK
jgi:antitoxin component of MazEF toxin-antitoxin module